MLKSDVIINENTIVSTNVKCRINMVSIENFKDQNDIFETL